ncbi:MAG: hypothetical protein ACJA1D_000675 [Polaribacter sp.]|jgi:hypothetical protein
MRTIKTIQLVVLTMICIGFTSCSNDDDSMPLLVVESEQVINLHAPQTTDFTTNPPTTAGDFVKFDFSTGTITTSETDWDIAFRGTTILVNGGATSGIAEEPTRTGNAGAYIENSTFANVTAVTETSFTQDSTTGFAIPSGSGNGWYTYAGPPTHLINPTAGKVLVFRTADNKYAKVEILNYYKDNDSSNPDNSRYFTFNYVYQPNDGATTFE